MDEHFALGARPSQIRQFRLRRAHRIYVDAGFSFYGFFGIKSYRDNQPGRSISFWKALQVGLLISIICSFVYAASWEVYMQTNPGFMERYTAAYLDKMKAKGTPQAEIDTAEQQMASMQEMYRNPAVRFGLTLSEILPVGIIVSLLSAAALRRKPERLLEQPV